MPPIINKITNMAMLINTHLNLLMISSSSFVSSILSSVVSSVLSSSGSIPNIISSSLSLSCSLASSASLILSILESSEKFSFFNDVINISIIPISSFFSSLTTLLALFNVSINPLTNVVGGDIFYLNNYYSIIIYYLIR